MAFLAYSVNNRLYSFNIRLLSFVIEKYLFLPGNLIY